MTTPRVRAGLRIPMQLNTALILLAREEGISKNALILKILWKYIEREPTAIEASKGEAV